MIYLIWEFEVAPAKVKQFEQIYAPQGAWAVLFQQSKNFHGTVLLKDHTKTNTYLTIDQWDNLADFENFKTLYADAYTKLDHQCESLTLAERKIGVFQNISTH